MFIIYGLRFIAVIAILLFINVSLYAQVDGGGGGAIPSIDEKPLSGGGGIASGKSSKPVNFKNRNTVSKQNATISVAKNTSGAAVKKQKIGKKYSAKSPTVKKYDGFTIGDKYTFLNYEIVKAAQPIYTIAAREAGAKGLVQVEVLIDGNGNVIEARARSGNKLLHPEAETAAFGTKFNKPAVYGKPARCFGFIVFRFGLRED